MPRLTFDATAIQSILPPGEELTIAELARRAFSPEASAATNLALMRAKRGVQVLDERGLVVIETREEVMLVRSSAQAGNASSQLQALLTRTIISTGPSADATDEDSEADPGPGNGVE